VDNAKFAQFDFDTGVYRASAIKKAAYRFSGEFDVCIDFVTENRMRVSLTRRDGRSPKLLATDFPKEVLDQELREQVAAETAGIRDVLLAHAFSELPLTDAVGETADFRDDPLGIDASQPSIRRSNLEG
jgi:His-Xaa-Ser system protein HxsD